MASLAKARRDFWPCRTGEPGRSFASDFVGPETGEGMWTWRPGGSYDSLLLDADGNIINVMRNGKAGRIRILRPELSLVVNSFPLEDVVGTPALAGGVLYAMTSTGFAAAINMKSGEHVWKTQYCKQNSLDPSSVGVCKDVVVLPGNPEERPQNSPAPAMIDTVYGLDVKNGKKLWEYRPGLIMMGNNFTPAFSDDLLVFMNSKADVCCLKVQDGKEKWKAVAPGVSRSFGGVCASPGSLVFAAVNRPGKKLKNAPSGGKGAARAYDLATGNMKWEVQFDLEVQGVPSLLSTGKGGSQILAIGLGATPGLGEKNTLGQPSLGDEWTAQVVGLDPETGKQLWAGERKVWHGQGGRMSDEQPDVQVNAITSPVGGGDGTFYYAWQGHLFHCNTEDGSERSRIDMFDTVQANPVLGPGFLVVAGVFSRIGLFRAVPVKRGKVLRPLDAPLPETGDEHFWNAKHGPYMSHQGFTKCKGPRSLLKPSSFFKYALLYSISPRHGDDNFYNSPAVDSQRNSYIAANFSELFVIRPDGRLRGSIATGPLPSTPVLLGKALYIVDGAGFAYSYDIETLTLNWRARYCVSNPWDSWSAAGKGDALIVGGNPDYRNNGAASLYRLSTEDGHVVWSFHYPREPEVMPYNMMPSITDDGMVITATQYGFVFCNSLETGELLWSAEPNALGGFTTATCAVGPCGLVANAWNLAAEAHWNKHDGGSGQLDVFDCKTGEKKYEKRFTLACNVAPLFLPPECATGSPDWQIVVALGTNPGPPKGHRDPLSGDSWKGLLLAVAADTGQEVWSWAPPVTRHATFRGSDVDDWYLPDAWTSVSADSTGTIYGSFHDGVMYAVRGGDLISKFDMRSCANCAPGIAPGFLCHANQFGLLIWRDAEIEEEWSASSDPRALNGKPPGGPVPGSIALGGPWDEGDGRLEWWEPRPWEEPKSKKATAEDLEDQRLWLEETEKLQQEALSESIAWSQARRAERAAAIKAKGGGGKPALERPKGKEGSLWTVVGGGSQGGIVARIGEGLKSTELGRLGTGASLEEIELKGERLHYKKLEGDGPDFGWVSLSFKGSPLVRRKE